MATALRYSLLAGLVLAGLAALAAQGASLGLGGALALLPLAGFPAWLALAHLAGARAAARRAILRDGARPWWGPLLGGALLGQALAVPVAIAAAWSLGWTLLAEGWRALGWVGGAAVLVYPFAVLLHRGAAPLRPFARLQPALIGAPVLAAAVLTAAWSLTTLGPLGTISLAQSVTSEPRYEGSSALLAWAVDAMALATGTRAWAEGWAEGRAGALVGLWRLVAAYGQFWLLALVFAGLLPGRGEGRRLLRPSDADAPAPVGPRRAAVAGFLLAILTLASVSLAAQGEAWASVQSAPELLAGGPALDAPSAGSGAPSLPIAANGAGPTRAAPARLSPAALRRAVEAERLGELACPEGTIAGLEALDREMREILAAQRARIEGAARAGFAAMRANVPGYLDWYYSLPAEYARTGHLLAGDAGEHLAARLRDHLEAGDPLGPLTAAMTEIEGNPERLAEWRAARAALLGPCADLRMPRDAGAWLVRAAAPEAVLLAGPSIEALDLETRLAGAGGAAVAGGLAGGILGKTVGKLVAKEAFGLAAEALGKLALGKAAGWLGGAAAGAGAGGLAGSVVPGVGTTVGAAVGGVVGGVGAWIATDYALLALDEAASREGFEREILAAIDEAEAEFLASLGG